MTTGVPGTSYAAVISMSFLACMRAKEMRSPYCAASVSIFGATRLHVLRDRVYVLEVALHRIGGLDRIRPAACEHFDCQAAVDTRHIEPVAGDAVGSHTIKAIVQLPPEACESLSPRVGDTITFTGTLVKCDSFMKVLFVQNGRLVSTS